MSALSRLEALSQALCLTLRTPTSERTIPSVEWVRSLVLEVVKCLGDDGSSFSLSRLYPPPVLHRPDDDSAMKCECDDELNIARR
jgi:hypothetical protein